MKRRAGQRKLRTREHVLADLSINHVERQILRCGFAVDRTDRTDYGIDLVMCTYKENGEVENGDVWFQVKATDHPELVESRKSIRARIDMAHLSHWLLITMLGKLTYAVLDKLLISLGFCPKPVRQPWRAYHHRKSDALILLRKRKASANVSEPDVLSIRRHLVEKGLIDETEFDQLLSEAA